MKLNNRLWLVVSPVIFVSLALTAVSPAQTITNLTPVVTVRATDAGASESGDTGAFAISRHGPTNTSLNVFYLLGGSASNGVDYALLPNNVLIPAGASSTPVVVSPIDDTLLEGPETVVLQLVPSPVMAPIEPYRIGSPGDATVSIEDDDVSATNLPPVIAIRATDPVASEPGVLTVIDDGVFTVYRSHGTNEDLRVHYFIGGTGSNGVDYAWLTNSVVLPAGSFSADIVVHALDDALAEGTETVVVRLLAPACPAAFPLPPGCYVVGPPSEAVVCIADNDQPPPPVVNIVAVDPEASEIPPVPPGLGMPQRIDPAAFKVWRNGATNLALDVSYSVGGTASNGVDYERLPGVLTIPAGAIAVHIEVLPIDDLLAEGTESVVLKLEPPACLAIYPPLPGCYQVGPSNRAEACILDNDFPTNLPPAVHVVRPMDGQRFPAPADVKIVADTVDLDGYVNHVEYYEGTRMIGEETRHFIVPPPPGQHSAYEFLWTNVPPGRYELRVKATDDQRASTFSAPVHICVVDTNLPPITNLPLVTITATDSVASEGTNCWRWPGWSASPCTNFCGTNIATFTVRRQGATNSDLAVAYWIGGTASNGVDYAKLPGAITLPAGQRAARITVLPIDDNLPERLETVVLALRVPAETPTNTPLPYLIGKPGKAAAVIVDNDQPRPVTGPLPDRCFHIMRPGANGQWFRIECSTNMVHWTAICTNVVTDGAVHFVDPEAEDSPSRFYRAVPETNPPQD